ncbi:hypothetical protein CMK20_18940 [Candidatus Poribacteria bacterium]|nr:hypothetical protein [Candidatus Poribacteria bacterium]
MNNLKKDRIKCNFCNKKCNLLNFKCKSCHNVFCQLHRYTHSHKCIDIKKAKSNNKIELIKSNPKVTSDKVQKI